MGIRLATLACLLAVPAFADELPALNCEGVAPDWQIAIKGDTAQFKYRFDEQMDIPQRSSAEGADWPKALTLIGRQSTAIIVLNERRCSTPHGDGFPIEANVLTQKAETPVLLTGCCTIAN
jgi:hypothetical protein